MRCAAGHRGCRINVQIPGVSHFFWSKLGKICAKRGVLHIYGEIPGQARNEGKASPGTSGSVCDYTPPLAIGILHGHKKRSSPALRVLNDSADSGFAS